LACRTGGRGWEMKLDLQTLALVAPPAAPSGQLQL
jgi:hypothetical protein